MRKIRTRSTPVLYERSSGTPDPRSFTVCSYALLEYSSTVIGVQCTCTEYLVQVPATVPGSTIVPTPESGVRQYIDSSA